MATRKNNKMTKVRKNGIIRINDQYRKGSVDLFFPDGSNYYSGKGHFESKSFYSIKNAQLLHKAFPELITMNGYMGEDRIKLYKSF